MASKNISNKLMIFGMTEKNSGILLFCAEKVNIWIESGVTTLGRRGVEVDTTLLGNDRNNVIADKLLACFSV